MNDDFKKILFGVLAGFVILMVVYVSMTFFWSCGFDPSCRQAAPVVGTPIPTLIPATLPAPVTDGVPNAFEKCEVKAMDLLGAWVDAGAPEADPFPFTDVSGNPCSGSFHADVWPLLNENDVWYPASLSCTSCHNSAFGAESAGLDLTSYAGILAGSQRKSADVAKGTPILASSWTASLLYKTLSLTQNIPLGHPTLAHPTAELVVYAGVHAQSGSSPAP